MRSIPPGQHDVEHAPVDNVVPRGDRRHSNHYHDIFDDPVDSDSDSVSTAIYDGDRTSNDSGHRRVHDHSDADHDADEKPVTWRSLPNKGQLAILTIARLSEPLAQTSLQAYLFYQLRSFDPSLPDSTISTQAGILQGSFTAAQFLTAVWWGRLADAGWVGRKRVLLIGLLGTCISSLGFGFSKSFTAAVIFRTIGGLLNSNVGVMRTLIAEIIEEKKCVVGKGLVKTKLTLLGINLERFSYCPCASISVSS